MSRNKVVVERSVVRIITLGIQGPPGVAGVAGQNGTADATPTTKGEVRLAGDLGGTADLPTVPGLALKAPLASPALTGIPTVPTASPSTNNSQIASTAYVER